MAAVSVVVVGAIRTCGNVTVRGTACNVDDMARFAQLVES